MFLVELARHLALEKQMRQVAIAAAGANPEDVEEPQVGEPAAAADPVRHDAALSDLGLVIEN